MSTTLQEDPRVGDRCIRITIVEMVVRAQAVPHEVVPRRNFLSELLLSLTRHRRKYREVSALLAA